MVSRSPHTSSDLSSMRLASFQFISWNILENSGVDPIPVFAKVGLNPQLMYEEDGRFPLHNVLALWDEMTEVLTDPSFGLMAGSSWHPSYFGILGYSMLMSTSLRSTLEKYVKYGAFITSKEGCWIEEDHAKQTLRFIIAPEEQRVGTAAREDAFVSCVLSILQTNFPKKLMPIGVSITHPSPKRPGKYFKAFRAPVRFKAAETSIELSLEDADYILPVAGAKALAGFSEREMANYLQQKQEASVAYKTKQLIDEHLASGKISLDDVAKHLALSPKTLQRVLRDEETSFKTLVEEVRLDLAVFYLKKPTLEISEISYLLGFSEQSAFSRFFKKWRGKSPARYRKERLKG